MSEYHKKYFCPRLLDYIVIVGSRHHNNNNNVAQTPELLRRYPLEDHADFPLPTDVIFFCQPEGCISVGPKRMSLRETTSFVFTLTEKDSGRVRYGMCVNFFRPFERYRGDRRQHSSSSDRQYSAGSSYTEGNRTITNLQRNESEVRSPRTSRRTKTASRVRNNTLTSLCIISHHPFFSTFRECLFILRRLIDACHERSCARRIGGSRSMSRDTVWGVLTGQGSDNVSSLVVHEIREIETWVLRLLSAPVPVPGKTKVEIQVLPRDVQPPLLFALPDHTRFSLIDFPLHLPLELLGVETCLKVLTAIMLEFKIIMQSRDYNALTMSVMAFVSMLYPLEYMFPVIPLLPTCMSSAEQLLLAPTPYLIGVPSSFFLYRKDFGFPDDVWLIDLDSNKITAPSQSDNNDLPPMPEPEGTILKNHLKQALTSMSMTPQPIKNLDVLAQNPEIWKRRESFSSNTGFNPLIYGNDVDSVDVATRVAMVRFFNSANTLGNFSEHTRTLRLYPRAVVAFQLYSFFKSRPVKTHFTHRLAKTQAVEFFGEWSLCPQNVAFLRVQTSVFDPLLIGDKAKWYVNQLQPITFRVYDESSSLGGALSSATEVISDDYPTDESGSDSDGAESTSSSYSSLSDFVTDMVNSEIDGDTPSFLPENQVLAVDESKVYNPPDKLQLPDSAHQLSDSAHSQNDSDDDGGDSSDSSYTSSPRYAPEPDSVAVINPNIQQMEASKEFRYDSGNITPTGRHRLTSRQDSSGSGSPPLPGRTNRAPLQPLNKSINSAFESYEKPPSPRDKVPPSPRERLPSGPHQSPVQRGPPSPRLPPSPRPPPSPRELNPPSPRLPRVPPPSPTLSRERFGSQGSQGSQGSVESGKGGSTVPRSLSMLHPHKGGSLDSSDNKHAGGSDRGASPSSLISTLSNDLTDLAHNASSTLSELFGSKTGSGAVPPISAAPQQQKLTPKPFAPLGNRKALVEKSGLVKHDTNRKPISKEKQKGNEAKGSSNSENQQFLKEVVSSVQEGQGISWLKMGRVKKLLEDENYRNFMISRLNKNLDKKLGDDDVHIEDVAISKAVYKGMLSLLKAFVHGLEITFQNYGIGGMASAFMVLEIAHTHHWARENTGSNKSDTSLTPELNSPYGSQESLSIKGDVSPRNPDSQSLNDESMVAALGHQQKPSPLSSHPYVGWNPENPVGQLRRHSSSPGSPVIVNGDEFENIEMIHSNLSEDNPYKLTGHPTQHAPDMNRNTTHANQKCDIIITGSVDDHRRACNVPHSMLSPTSGSDVMLEMVKNKGLIKTAKMDERMGSIDSDMSEASTLGKGSVKKGRSSSLYSNKSSLSTGSRYREGQIISTSPIPGSPEFTRTYLFEGLTAKERSRLWDQMQFWEDVYLDAVAQERDIIGMDQGPAEMMDRYNSLGPGDRKRLEHDEDKLLSVMLYNLVSFMVMTRVHKMEIKKKIRRLLGKSHMGLNYSQEINNLLDKIEPLHGNDIDLRPMGSRFMQKQSFTVHWGNDNKGDMLFMEVCDDCIILRSVTSAICDRWWYEKLVNMTYCPKTKVLCLWRKLGDKVQLNQFYTKKCRELYFCVKEAMEKAATRNNSKIPGPELGGEFPVQDVKSGQGGLLQVCMEGIGLLLANSKSFIELNRIKKCFTLKGEIFILEEFDSKSKQIVQHRFQSSMANSIGMTVHRVITVQVAKLEQQIRERQEGFKV